MGSSSKKGRGEAWPKFAQPVRFEDAGTSSKIYRHIEKIWHEQSDC